MTETSRFIGLTEAKARALAAEAGLVVAVNKGVSALLTNSMEMNRVTFSVSVPAEAIRDMEHGAEGM